ncbi:F510_1955 family glycosylhydrolase [Aeromicrobium sp.]|uniref:F510_1955 family glycosylhydrolase n=1 Tax=Aeromicrobium sp. TaxID=1871063 RepID=UPI003D6BBC83
MRRVLVTMSVAVVLLAGCQFAPDNLDHSKDLAHIHGLGVDPADGGLYAASHNGLFKVTGKGEPKQVAGRTQDFMGFTVVGPRHFLGSGHPGEGDEEQPPNLGLIESTDAGETWTSLSLSGKADFHAMEAKHDQVYGFDSQTGQIMVSDDKKSWDERAVLPSADIAVSPGDADEILATTEQGVQRSTDGAKNFSTVAGSPTLIFIDWVSADRLVGVAPDGAVHVSDDGATSWSKGGAVAGEPEAILAHGTADVYVATGSAIYRSTDDGASFTVFQRL